MSNRPKLYNYTTTKELVERVRDDLNNNDFVLLYAFNGTGKTRLSREFNKKGKQGGVDERDTLYFNAYTEDLFHWDNDLENDSEYLLEINSDSKFVTGFRELALEERIFAYLERYVDFDFKIDYENWRVAFSRGDASNIKISRGEQNVFVWCIFLAICEVTIDGAETYNWVKYFYIDDPISSLDDNNAIAVASDLSLLIKKSQGKVKCVISSHHNLFFNVMCNELRKNRHAKYFLHKNGDKGYTLQKTDDTPFFHHVATLSELKTAVDSGAIKTYHFNTLRSILEKTSSFFGFNDFGRCIDGIEDEVLFKRALNLLSHGKYSIYEPVEMNPDNKELFIRIFNSFIDKYKFHLPSLITDEPKAAQAPAQHDSHRTNTIR